MKRLGFAYDWSKEVTTCLPEYYRWNQWFFLKFYEHGLAYRKKSKVNWCPECATVLANEQVLSNGCCWRHEDTHGRAARAGAVVPPHHQLRRRTAARPGQAATDWPEKVRTMQRNWIGRSEGALVDFKLDGPAGPAWRQDHGLHHAHRHDLWRDLAAVGAGASDRHRPDRQRSRRCWPRWKT